MERDGKSIRSNKFLYIIIIVFCILNKIFRVPWLGYELWLFAANVSPVTSISTAQKNDWPL